MRFVSERDQKGQAMLEIDVSVALPPSFESAEHIAAAEELGYRRAYLYDTPFEGDDVWLDLHRAAELTTTIELGPAVLIPTQRHPLVNAAQTVSLHRLAPRRVVPSFGTGFSSRSHRPAADPVVVHGDLY